MEEPPIDQPPTDMDQSGSTSKHDDTMSSMSSITGHQLTSGTSPVTSPVSVCFPSTSSPKQVSDVKSYILIFPLHLAI